MTDKVTFATIKVAEGLEFSDISAELRRKYTWTDGSYLELTYPIALRVSESGGHYVICDDGEVYYIPVGWIFLNWKNEDGENHVDF